MNIKVAFWRHHQEYLLDAKILMARVPHAENIYDAIWHLQLEEYFSCHVELLRHWQERQIPIRWED